MDGTQPTPADTWHPEVAHAEFRRLAGQYGADYGGFVVTAPAGHARDCWTHAWHAAVELGHTYAEGLAYVRGRWRSHAWTLDPAGIVHEHCWGVDAAAYRGLPLDTRLDAAPAAISAQWGRARVCVVEAALAAGYGWPDVAAHLLAPGFTPAGRR